MADPSQFYTGLVADLYRPLRGGTPDPEFCARFVRKHGEPALELGCGDGDPILTLRQLGIDVDGIDASADMIERCLARAAQLGVTVDARVQTMQELSLPRRYRSIYLAGPTFNVLPDDAVALAALQRIAAHLDDEGCAMVTLFVPEPLDEQHLGRWREDVDDQGRTIRFTTTAQSTDNDARLHTSTLRYERTTPDGDLESLERDFVIHWYTQEQFVALAQGAGLRVSRRIPDDDAASAVVFWLVKPRP